MRIPLHHKPIDPALFNYQPPTFTTKMSRAQYCALIEAARAKDKMPEFRIWLRNRKIILKG